jgi:Galactose oxidase, central domain/Kelch motif
MNSLAPLRRAVLAALLAAACGAAPGLGCSAKPAPPDGHALREVFPGQAAAVLDAGEPLVAAGAGFVRAAPEVASPRGGFRHLVMELPRAGDGAVVVHMSERGAVAEDGFEARVREVGASGEGTIVGHAVAYAHAGGTAYWSIARGGAEEWLHLARDAVRAGEVAAAWEVEGAALQQHGDRVSVVGPDGTAGAEVSAPVAYAAGGRRVRAWLTAAGSRIELRVDAAGEEVLVDPIWMAVGSMTVAREYHTATRLGDGTVVVAGGDDGMNDSLGDAELYDPVAMTWSEVGMLGNPRTWHTATLLPNGKVLVAGGQGLQEVLTSAELYDPATKSWTATGSMGTARELHTATLLADGTVLVVGGGTGDESGPTASTEVYDPATGVWTAEPNLNDARIEHTATLLPGGDVLVVGGDGNGDGNIAPPEIYDPVAHTWTLAPADPNPRADHVAALLGTGIVLIVGGGGGGDDETVVDESYDPATMTWPVPASLPLASEVLDATGTLLGNGFLLVAGGRNVEQFTATNAANLYDPGLDVWASAATMNVARAAHTATLLADGSVLVAGGISPDNETVIASAEVYESQSGTGLGSPCTFPTDCFSGFCSGGVCCNEACGAGPCESCTKAGGATSNGTCTLLTGPACNDGNACTTGETCQNGVCGGGVPTVCTPADGCHDAVCEPATGKCSPVARADGTACDDGDLCTAGDVCKAGACGGTAVTCVAIDACHDTGTCDPATGICSNPDDPTKPGCSSSSSGGSSDAGPAPMAPSGAETCNVATDCATGHCSHGVCCNSDCTTPCHSCAVPGSVGTCTPEPKGVDLNQDCGAVANCLSTCGGEASGACIGAGQGTQCAASVCLEDGVHVDGPAYCPSEGATCPAGSRVPFSCSPYRCVTAFGACATICQSIDDCASPFVCSPDHQCVAPPDSASGTDSGCALAARPEGSGAAGLLGLFAALALAGRRRREAA